MSTNETDALDRFDSLEERIIKLLDVNVNISSDNKAMRDALAAREREVAGLIEKIKKLEIEREAVRVKVDTLLKKLDSLV
ncbi:MAG: hypothetical protein A3J24_09025 [Deltaproteobacteria bacterium RIFCSPLOWO2_02_FULL_53_8]|nr:MAG: hypothetical protein A3J24_09025 [Deltaproteobacteria bacterium RIFCSPLOWO2_02_FULL_53_8]